MKKGFTLFEVGAVLGAAGLIMLASTSYRDQFISNEQAKSLAKDLYQYNALVGRHLRQESSDDVRKFIGDNKGAAWLNISDRAMPGGKTHNFGLTPTTTIKEGANGSFTAKTVWSPVIRDGRLNEPLMGMAALYASSMILTDNNSNRSNQGVTAYCPSSMTDTNKDIISVCKDSRGAIVSMNYGVPRDSIDVDIDIDALSVNHKNTMQASLVFGGSESGGTGASGFMRIPFKEVSSSIMSDDGWGDLTYSKMEDGYSEYHYYSEYDDRYSIDIYGDKLEGWYSREGHEINYSGNWFDGSVYYNQNTRQLTHYSSEYCGGTPTVTSFPFSEENLDNFTLNTDNTWNTEYTYTDPEGGMHYYYPDWDEYSYYHVDGRNYYRDYFQKTYNDGTYQYTEDSDGQITVEHLNTCSKTYDDQDLVFSDNVTQVSSISPSNNHIVNVARIHNGDISNESQDYGRIRLGQTGGFNEDWLVQQDLNRTDINLSLWSSNLRSPDVKEFWTNVDGESVVAGWRRFASYGLDAFSGDVFYRPNVIIDGRFGVLGDVKVFGAISAYNPITTSSFGSVEMSKLTVNDDEGLEVLSSRLTANTIKASAGIDIMQTTQSLDMNMDPVGKNITIKDGSLNALSLGSHMEDSMITGGDIHLEYERGTPLWDYDNDSYAYNLWDSGALYSDGNAHVENLIFNHDPGATSDGMNLRVRNVTAPMLVADSGSFMNASPGSTAFYFFDDQQPHMRPGRYANGDLAFHIPGTGWHKASPGFSDWGSKSYNMYMSERDAWSKFYSRATSFCRNTYGSNYFPVQNATEYGFDHNNVSIDRRVNNIYDGNGVLVDREYFIRHSPTHSIWHRIDCARNIN